MPGQHVSAVSVLLLLVVAVVAFAAGFAAARVRVRRAALAPVPDAPLAAPVDVAGEPARIAFTNHAIEGSREWATAMGDLGTRMRESGVRLVVFTHGSFVGDDPLAIASLLDDAIPLLPEIGRKLRGLTRAHLSRLLGDLSNFPTSTSVRSPVRRAWTQSASPGPVRTTTRHGCRVRFASREPWRSTGAAPSRPATARCW